MTRQPLYAEIYDLPIGGEIEVSAIAGETAEAALRRLRVRTSKWIDRFYRLKVTGSSVCLQRTLPGQHTKMGDWLMMMAGDRLLLKSCPTERDVKKAWDAANYLSGVRPMRLRDRGQGDLSRGGHWRTFLDEERRLVAECVVDVDGRYIRVPTTRSAPLRLLWRGEWP